MLLACLLLGSGVFSAVSFAIGEGQIPNFSNPAWQIGGGNVGKPADGSYVFGNGSNGCTLFLTLNLQPGERYKFSGKFSLSGNATSPSYYVSLLPAEGSEIILVDQKSKGTVNLEREFVLPDNGGQVILFVALGAWSTLDYSTTWKIENTSTDKGVLNSIKEGFSKLWEWLKSILDNIKEIPTKIGQFITSLGDRIKTFFTDLVDNMRNFFSSLGDRISGFFNDIWEKIKAFFLPSEGYFDEYSAEFNVFIDDHFGFLAQLPDELSLIVNTLITYEPSEPPFIDFPEVKLPLPGKTYTIVKQQRYTFDFLSDQPFSTLYTAYQGFVWLAYCLMLFNFLKHKYNVIFGGDGSAG